MSLAVDVGNDPDSWIESTEMTMAFFTVIRIC